MARLKGIFLYFLIIVMLVSAFPFSVMAEPENSGMSIIDWKAEKDKNSNPSIIDGGKKKDKDDNSIVDTGGKGGESIIDDSSDKSIVGASSGENNGNNEDGTDKGDKEGRNKGSRYDLNTIGLDKEGKPTLKNIPKSLNYREWLALLYNWAGMKIDDQNRGVDKKTGKIKFAPPKAKYDVVVNIPTGDNTYKTQVYSMFGFKSNYTPYAKGDIEKIDVSYANKERYIDLGINGRYTNWLDTEPTIFRDVNK